MNFIQNIKFNLFYSSQKLEQIIWNKDYKLLLYLVQHKKDHTQAILQKIFQIGSLESFQYIEKYISFHDDNQILFYICCFIVNFKLQVELFFKCFLPIGCDHKWILRQNSNRISDFYNHLYKFIDYILTRYPISNKHFIAILLAFSHQSFPSLVCLHRHGFPINDKIFKTCMLYSHSVEKCHKVYPNFQLPSTSCIQYMLYYVSFDPVDFSNYVINEESRVEYPFIQFKYLEPENLDMIFYYLGYCCCWGEDLYQKIEFQSLNIPIYDEPYHNFIYHFGKFCYPHNDKQTIMNVEKNAKTQLIQKLNWIKDNLNLTHNINLCIKKCLFK